MQRQIAYCSVCDRDVQLVVTDELSHDGQANLHDAEIVCLEVGDRCAGCHCPISDTQPAVMAARLVRNGLQTTMNPVVTLDCARCGEKTQHVLIERSWATCNECGATTLLRV
jgi:hypothetical protein